MKDESFELLTKLYSEFSTFRHETTGKLATMDKRLTTIDNRTIRMENEHGKKLDALMDGYQQLAEGQEEIKSQIAEFDKQEIETTGLKAVK
jgi:uncharacterized phage infection (PIP) family protein YhgE